MSIHVRNINKEFGDFTALSDVSLEIKPGELVALLGPSGSGKTTLLRIIAGLENADSGEVVLDGMEAAEKNVRERNVGFVFQHYALFKHMTVYENVAFGLKIRKKNRPTDVEIRRKVLELLRLVHLDGLHGRYPSQLSGGQRQRVALARALAVEPKVLLLDEPFGALDAKVRKELRRFMRRLHEDIHITSIFVTHDQEEAMEVADRVVVMSNGRIEQVGTPDEVWNKPKNGFVYDFLGNYNVFEGWKDKDGNVHLTEYDIVKMDPPPPSKQPDNSWLNRHPVASQLLSNVLPSSNIDIPEVPKRKVKSIRGEGREVTLYVRPHEMIIATEANGEEYITAKITHINPAGPLVKLELERRNGNLLQAEVSAEVVEQLKLKRDREVLVRPKKFKVFE
ncbi:MAG: sulfate transporter, ATPase subunit [Rickettsiaceae bacterium]|jgi:sulfate transport system ATP-binding protein|nr:sulfate transporter, ATPase subunit [Rickettsiaceae bacterium]